MFEIISNLQWISIVLRHIMHIMIKAFDLISLKKGDKNRVISNGQKGVKHPFVKD